MKNFFNDIDVIKSCYENYSLVTSEENVPDFTPYFHPKAEFIFNNIIYNCDETLSLINVFCKEMKSIKVNILDEIQCLDPVNRSYLMLSNWECETVKGQKGLCPMMQIITINSNRIIKAIGVIHMGDLSTGIT